MEAPEIFLSIIMPAFNRGYLLGESMRSILNQRNVELELIIVDDGSDDDTGSIVREVKDDRVKYIRTENKERGSARNTGVKIASGQYVNYFDSDDIFKPCLGVVKDFIRKNNHPNIVFGEMECISQDRSLIEKTKLPFTGFKRNILHNNFLACGSVFLKREIALTHLFSEDRRLSGTEDWELWLRIYSIHDFLGCPIIIFQQRQHSFRSLNQVNCDRVMERENVFVKLIDTNRISLMKRFSRAEINLLIADRFTLIALSQCEARHKSLAFEYWKKSIIASFLVVKRKRFLAIGKKLILSFL